MDRFPLLLISQEMKSWSQNETISFIKKKMFLFPWKRSFIRKLLTCYQTSYTHCNFIHVISLLIDNFKNLEWKTNPKLSKLVEGKKQLFFFLLSLKHMGIYFMVFMKRIYFFSLKFCLTFIIISMNLGVFSLYKYVTMEMRTKPVESMYFLRVS